MTITVWPERGTFEVAEFHDCLCIENNNILSAKPGCTYCRGTGIVSHSASTPELLITASNWVKLMRLVAPQVSIKPEEYCGRIPNRELPGMFGGLHKAPGCYYSTLKEIILCAIYNKSDLLWG